MPLRHLVPSLLCLLAIAASPARAAVFTQIIDRGVPTDGTRTMDGFRGFTIRLISDEGPITRVVFADDNAGGSAFIAGDLHQRWTDPSGQSIYTATSPGFLAADNTTPTDLNFDSHFLPPPPEAQVVTLAEAFPGFQERVPFSPVASTSTVGYADPEDQLMPIGVNTNNRLQLTYDLPASAGVTQLDLAYIVTDSLVFYNGGVGTVSGGMGQAGSIVVPEPTSAGVMAICAAIAGLVRFRGSLGRRRSGIIVV